ncbi:MAG: hypothetical protein M3O34_13560 [Chloroflexota bacterium]|nr:hypothetical protein [Chloroflexota bacterium]
MVLLPAVVLVLCLVLGWSTLERYAARRRTYELVWAVTFLSFGVAAACEVYGTLAGWSTDLTYLYYLTGRSLSVGFLAVGTLYLLVPRSLAHVALGVALVQTLSMALLLLRLQPDPELIRELGWRALSKEGAVRALAMAVNYLGTVIVVVGSFASAYALWVRGLPGRAGGVLMIGVGTVVVAVGASLTARGEEYLYGGMALGLLIVYLGYRLVGARPRPAPSSPTPGAPDLAGPAMRR